MGSMKLPDPEYPALTPKEQIEKYMLDMHRCMDGVEHRVLQDPSTGYLAEAVKALGECAKVINAEMQRMGEYFEQLRKSMEGWEPFLEQMKRDAKVNEDLFRDFPGE